jgi:hypothetical protein
MATLLELASRELGSPTVESVLRLSVKLAQAANDLKGLSGADKMSLVLSTLRETLNDPLVKDKMGAEEHVKLIALVDTVIPETLTLVIAAGRGEIDLRKPSVGCLARFAPLFCRAVTVLMASPSVDVSGSPAPAPAPAPSPAPAPAPVASPAEVAVAVPKDTDNSAPAPPPETTASPSS